MAAPDPAIVSDPDVTAAGASVVRVLGTACGLGVEGSGWAAAPGIVVTNAHVIAGEDDTTVTTQGGASLEATPVHYDVENDLALLRVDVDLPALAIAADPQSSTPAAVLGYPENGPFEAAPARLGETRETISEDSYGRGPVSPLDRLAARRRAQRQLRWTAGRSSGACAGHRLRRDDQWHPRRLCGSQRGRSRRLARRWRRGRHGPLHELGPVTYVR